MAEARNAARMVKGRKSVLVDPGSETQEFYEGKGYKAAAELVNLNELVSPDLKPQAQPGDVEEKESVADELAAMKKQLAALQKHLEDAKEEAPDPKEIDPKGAGKE